MPEHTKFTAFSFLSSACTFALALLLASCQESGIDLEKNNLEFQQFTTDQLDAQFFFSLMAGSDGSTDCSWGIGCRFYGDAGDDLGMSVANAGDVDGDGYQDIISGGNQQHTFGGRGTIAIVSGQTGAPILEMDGPSVFGSFGVAVSTAGDVDGDNNDEVLVGEPRGHQGSSSQATGRVLVLDHDGTSEMEILGGQIGDNFGASVESIDDLDGDGRNDFLATALFAQNGSGCVYVYLAITGTYNPAPYRMHCGQGNDAFGEVLKNLGDINGDHLDDYAAAAPSSSTPYVKVFSGLTGNLIYQLSSPAGDSTGRFGSAIASGDLNNDGIPDIVIGATNEVAGSKGRIYAFDGSNGSLLGSLDGNNVLGLFGRSLASADLNDDGRDEIIVGESGRVHAVGYSNNQLQILDTIIEATPFNAFGSKIAVVNNLNNNVPIALALGVSTDDPDWQSSGDSTDYNGSVHVLAIGEGNNIPQGNAPGPENVIAFRDSTGVVIIQWDPLPGVLGVAVSAVNCLWVENNNSGSLYGGVRGNTHEYRLRDFPPTAPLDFGLMAFYLGPNGEFDRTDPALRSDCVNATN